MTSRTLKILLAISIAVNLFALGAIGGGAASWLKTAPRRPIFRAAESLPQGDRDAFRHVLRTVARDARPIQRDARDNRRLAAQLFVQPTIDAAAVNAAMTRARDDDFAVRARLEIAMVGFASTLSQPERTAMARALSQGGPLRQPQQHNAKREL